MKFLDVRRRKIIGQINKLFDELVETGAKLGEKRITLQELTEAIPSGYPDGTGILGPMAWLQWAKSKLGYTDSESTSKCPVCGRKLHYGNEITCDKCGNTMCCDCQVVTGGQKLCAVCAV